MSPSCDSLSTILKMTVAPTCDTPKRMGPSMSRHPPVKMLLVLTCLLNPSHHPACDASPECSAEVQLFKEQKEKAEKVMIHSLILSNEIVVNGDSMILQILK